MRMEYLVPHFYSSGSLSLQRSRICTRLAAESAAFVEVGPPFSLDTRTHKRTHMPNQPTLSPVHAEGASVKRRLDPVLPRHETAHHRPVAGGAPRREHEALHVAPELLILDRSQGVESHDDTERGAGERRRVRRAKSQHDALEREIGL